MEAGVNPLLWEKKFEILLEQTNKKLREEITTLRQEISSLHQEIDNLRATLNKTTPPFSFSGEEQTKLSPPKMPREEAREEKIKPRHGDYTSEDVDINKMFYFGGGRKR